jgi:hypothetical protein
MAYPPNRNNGVNGQRQLRGQQMRRARRVLYSLGTTVSESPKTRALCERDLGGERERAKLPPGRLVLNKIGWGEVGSEILHLSFCTPGGEAANFCLYTLYRYRVWSIEFRTQNSRTIVDEE